MSKLIDRVFYSSLNRKNVSYRAIVPHDGMRTNRPVRVLYLLHGLFGSWKNWTDLTNLRAYAEETDFLIVMPDGGDNWYTDGDEKYESYLIYDLLPAIEKEFGAGIGRRDRAIAGNSMGGYGAFKLALKYPMMFSFAASFSGVFHVTRLTGDAGELAPSVLRVFGDETSETRYVNDLFRIAQGAAEISKTLPSIHFDCGADDEFLAVNREFSSFLSRAGIEHEFQENEGGHDWAYWDRRIRHLLPMVSKHFG